MLRVIALALASGLATSVGPCIAPRYLALVGVTAGRTLPERLHLLVAFISGTVLGYVVLGNAAALLARVLAASAYVYVGMGLALVSAGIIGCIRARAHQCRIESKAPAGSTFLLGVTSVAVISPCCMPLVSGIGALASSAQRPLEATYAAIAFATGHLTPLACAALGSGFALRLPQPLLHATSVVSAGLMMALGAYYLVLA